MKIHEYQAKGILRDYGVATPESVVVTDPEGAASAFEQLGCDLSVVKAQIHAGGRGKGGVAFGATSVLARRGGRGGRGDMSETLAENRYVDEQMREWGYDVKGGQWVGGVALANDSARRLAADEARREEFFLREQFRAERAAAAEADREATSGQGVRLGGREASAPEATGGEQARGDGGRGAGSLLRRRRRG